MKTPERKIELAQRRIMQRNAMPTRLLQFIGKYIPAGPHKNTKPHNR